MRDHYGLRLLALFRAFSRYAVLIIVGVGILELIGSAFDLTIISDAAPGFETMQVNSAGAFILSGAALWLANRERPSRASLTVWHICAALVAMLGLLTLGQYLFGWDLGIPILLGWLGAWAKNHGFYDIRFGFVMLITVMSLLLSVTAWLTSAWLHRLDSERRRAEEELRQSQQLFQNAFEYSAIGMGLVGLNGQWLRVNESLCRLTGYPRNELLAKTFQDITHPDDLDKDLDYVRQMLAGEIRTYQMEKRYFHKDGHIVWVLLSASLVRDRKDQPLYFISQIEDITERKRAEERIAYQGHLLENVHDAVVATDAQLNITVWNRAAEEMYGYTVNETLGRKVNEVLNFEWSNEQCAAAAKSLNERGSYRFEVLHHHQNGQPFWVEANTFALQDPNGQLYAYVTIVRDVTERRRAEEKLHESERRFRALIENGSDQVSILAADGSLLYENPSANPTLGYQPNQFLGQSLLQLVHPDDSGELQATFSQLLQDPTFRPRGQFRVRASDGNWRWVEAVGANLLDEPAVGGIVVNYHDISERKQAEDHVETQLQRFEALHAIDVAITGSLDLRLTLSVVLKQTTVQLGIDAASVLLFNPYTQALTYAAGHGFRTRAIEQSRTRPGEGVAGTALLGRKIVHQHIPLQPPDPARAALLAEEGFVEHYAAPLIAKGSVVGVLEVFHRAPFEADEPWKLFLETLAGQTAIAVDNAHLFESLQRSNLNLMLAYDTTIEGWSRALDLRDKETEGHTQRVTTLSLELAVAMRIPDSDLAHIRRGALLHDIGKMGVPDHILLKPGHLTDEEWALMRKHPTFAFDLLTPIEFLRNSLDIPYCHHEKWDGTGYPRGLKGEQIPIAARIFAIVDVYDALTSDRPYRAGWTRKKTLEHIRSQAGTHFDPRVVEAFMEMMKNKV